METLKSWFFCMLALLISFSLLSCGSVLKSPPDYRAQPFRVSFRGNSGTISFLAEGIYQPSHTADAPWDFTVRITSGTFSEGLLLSRENGTVSLSYEKLTVNTDTADGLLSLALLPISQGALTPISLDKSGSIPLLYAQIREEGCEPIELWLDPQSGYPKTICKGMLRLEILSFDPLASDT